MSLARLALVLMAGAALAPMTVGATVPHPAAVSPKDGARLKVGRTPTFKIRSSGTGSVWVLISKSAHRGADGVIADDASIGRARKKGAVFVYKPKFFDYPGFWANQRKEWYWQPYRIACGEEPKSSDCKVEGKVRSFRLG